MNACRFLFQHDAYSTCCKALFRSTDTIQLNGFTFTHSPWLVTAITSQVFNLVNTWLWYLTLTLLNVENTPEPSEIN